MLGSKNKIFNILSGKIKRDFNSAEEFLNPDHLRLEGLSFGRKLYFVIFTI
jgi:hypothetical protein